MLFRDAELGSDGGIEEYREQAIETFIHSTVGQKYGCGGIEEYREQAIETAALV